MSDKGGSNSGMIDNRVTMLEDSVRRIKRIFGNVRDRLDRQDVWLEKLNPIPANVRREGPNERRQGRREHRMEEHSDLEVDIGIDEDAIVDAEIGKRRNRGVRQERRGRNFNGDEVDGNLGNIKMTILSFKGTSDPEAYLEWEKKIELIFDYHNYSGEKKVKITILEFTDYAITWWDQVVTTRRRSGKHPINI